MECFDHGKEMVGLCGWCGKQMCPSCIGRQDGRKKYCRDCASKMGGFTAPDRTAEKLQAHLNEKAQEVASDENPVISHIPTKMKIQTGHPPEKRIDPKVFELDDEDGFVPSRKRHDEEVHEIHHEEKPVHEPPKPIHTEHPKYTPLHHEPPKPAHQEPPKSVGSAAGSFRHDAPVNNSSRMALGMLASEAKNHNSAHPSPHSVGMKSIPGNATPEVHSSLHPTQTPPVPPRPAPPKPVINSAASKALSFFAQSAKEQQQKNKQQQS